MTRCLKCSKLEKKVEEINKGKVSRIEKLVKIIFVKAGKETSVKNKTTKRKDARWEGKWKIAVDLDTLLVFPLVATTQRPDLVIWSEERKKAVIMEFTVSWEDNIEAAEDRKERRYKDLIERCEEEGWEIDYFHIGVGARGFVDEEEEEEEEEN